MWFSAKRRSARPTRNRPETLLRLPRVCFPSSLRSQSTISIMMSTDDACGMTGSKYDFSVLNQKGITYVAMTDRDMPLRIVFVCVLDDFRRCRVS